MLPSSLNKLQAQVLRAKLMNALNAKKLEEEYEAELRHTKGEGGGVRMRVEVLGEMVRQERFGAGMADQKNWDAWFAKAIMGDLRYGSSNN
jgi:hypothetical protein